MQTMPTMQITAFLSLSLLNSLLNAEKERKPMPVHKSPIA